MYTRSMVYREIGNFVVLYDHHSFNIIFISMNILIKWERLERYMEKIYWVHILHVRYMHYEHNFEVYIN